MRVLAMAFVSCLSVPAFGVTIPVLPQSAFADTEVSTNIVFVVVNSSSSALVLEARINDYDDEPDPIEFKVDVVQEEE